jgi:26S proteasome regulatory subunit N9
VLDGLLQVKAAYVPFYKSSLLFLACIDVDAELSSEEKVIRARDLSIAALLGDKIYNFGELVGIGVVHILRSVVNV